MFDLIKGVGPKKAKLLNKLKIKDQYELANVYPHSYEDRRFVKELIGAELESSCVFCLKILKKSRTNRIKGNSAITNLKACDASGEVEIIYFKDRFSPMQLTVGETYYFFGQIRLNDKKLVIYNPKFSKEASGFMGILPVYPLVKGLSQKDMRSFVKSSLDIISYKDFIPDYILEKRSLISYRDAINKIHLPENYEDISKAKRRLIYSRYFCYILAIRYVSKPSHKNHHKIKSFDLVDQFIKSLPFEMTPDQKKVVEEIKADLSKDKAMNRLVQGDVGSGKTIVAIIAALMVAGNGRQVAILAPTEIVARQHYEKYRSSFEKLSIKSELLVGALKSVEKNNIKESLKNGHIDIIFGTHALIQEDVIFKNLALVVADEQHRFGVLQRDALIKKGNSPHLLTMTATPIPRTLSLSIYSNLDISTIKSMPIGRKEVETYVVNKKYEKRIADFILKNIQVDNRVYLVSPAIEENDDFDIESVESISKRFSKYLKGIDIGVLHGKLKAEEKIKIMDSFKKGEIKVLVSTTVIEVGVDVKEANLIIIYNAERFGLSSLHQLRGRVGRGDKKATCILVCSSNSEESRKRMKIMAYTNDGFEIAEQDLLLRGPGEILGENQSGQSYLNSQFGNSLDILVAASEDCEEYLSRNNLEDDKLLFQEVNKLIQNVASFGQLN